MLFFSDVTGNFVICDRLCSLDRKHKGKGMWFDLQKPFVGRSVASEDDWDAYKQAKISLPLGEQN